MASRAPRRNPLAVFFDPVRRPRAIVWTFVALILIAILMAVALSATSTRWFCAQSCHKVQDDTIAAYDASTHSEISCLACHEPVNANSVQFLLAKLKALGELYYTVAGTYDLPLNKGSLLSLNPAEMGSDKCVQCHSGNRAVTPAAGIVIDHKVHADKGVSCTVCHNRVAHDESGLRLTLTSPSGKPNTKHPDYMNMDACFRCHDLDGKKSGPGRCEACHTPGFKLTPPSHESTGWFPKGHAEAGLESRKESAELLKEFRKEEEKLKEEGIDPKLVEPVEYCSTCHGGGNFCDTCHGLPMPHPTGFKSSHGELGKKQPAVCARCHATSGATGGTEFCNSCHHPSSTPGVAWVKQHPQVVRQTDPGACFDCHELTFCSTCHVSAIR